MKDLILSPIPLDELLSRVREIVKEERRLELQQAVGERLISPAEACKLFHPAISRVTLQAWTDAGHLKRYDIASRVYYRYSEIIDAAKHLKKYQRQ